jgi:hypothetical protein
MEDLVAGDEVTRLGCLCVFHRKCLFAWYAHSSQTSCPTHIPP